MFGLAAAEQNEHAFGSAAVNGGKCAQERFVRIAVVQNAAGDDCRVSSRPREAAHPANQMDQRNKMDQRNQLNQKNHMNRKNLKKPGPLRSQKTQHASVTSKTTGTSEASGNRNESHAHRKPKNSSSNTNFHSSAFPDSVSLEEEWDSAYGLDKPRTEPNDSLDNKRLKKGRDRSWNAIN